MQERRVWVKDPGMALITSNEDVAEERERWRRGSEPSTSNPQVSTRDDAHREGGGAWEPGREGSEGLPPCEDS